MNFYLGKRGVYIRDAPDTSGNTLRKRCSIFRSESFFYYFCNMKKSIFYATGLLLLSACSPKQNAVSSTDQNNTQGTLPEAVAIDVQPTGMVLKASAFRMSGDYANNVAVTLNANGGLAYYPAPTDISAASAPKALGDGWWLNRQGLGPNSVFTKWTFEEYHALPSTPSQAEILAAIIPGATVTEYRQLPVSASQAMTMPTEELLKMVE